MGAKWHFVLIHCMCHQKHNFMLPMACSQQCCSLELCGTHKPNPREQFIGNLILQVEHHWQEQGAEVFAGSNVSEDVRNPHSQILCLFCETDLVLLWGMHCGRCTVEVDAKNASGRSGGEGQQVCLAVALTLQMTQAMPPPPPSSAAVTMMI